MPFEVEDAECIKATKRALLIKAPEFDDEPFWVPISQLDEDSDVYEEGGTGTLIVTDWYADKVGWV